MFIDIDDHAATAHVSCLMWADLKHRHETGRAEKRGGQH